MRDLDRALVFYGVLGFELVRRAEGDDTAEPRARDGRLYGIFDLGNGIASPVLELIAGGAGLKLVFLVSALVVLCAMAFAVRLLFAAAAQPGARQPEMLQEKAHG